MTTSSDPARAAPPGDAARPWCPPELEDLGEVTVERLREVQRQAYEEAWAQGREAGYRDGRAAGEARAREAVAPVLARLEAVLELLARPLDDLDEEIEEQLVALATAIARQLVRRELRTDPGHVVGAVRQAIAVLPAGAREVRLALHPEDAALVREALSLDAGGSPWRIVEDPLLERGGCRVETECSRVDATVESRLAAAIAHVLGGREGDESGSGAATGAATGAGSGAEADP